MIVVDDEYYFVWSVPVHILDHRECYLVLLNCFSIYKACQIHKGTCMSFHGTWRNETIGYSSSVKLQVRPEVLSKN